MREKIDQWRLPVTWNQEYASFRVSEVRELEKKLDIAVAMLKSCEPHTYGILNERVNNILSKLKDNQEAV